MSVKVRPYKNGGWHVDVIIRLPTGKRHRERKRLKNCSQATARKWGEQRLLHVMQHGLPEKKKEVPTLNEFAPRWMDGYAKANRQKPSGIAAKQSILDVHLLPLLGDCKLDVITS